MKHQETIAREQWHAFSEAEVYSELKSSENGLSNEEVSRRLQFYGENRLPEGKKITLWQIILHQLINSPHFYSYCGCYCFDSDWGGQGCHFHLPCNFYKQCPWCVPGI